MGAEEGRRALCSLGLFQPPPDLLGIPLPLVQPAGRAPPQALPVRCALLRFPAPAPPRTGQVDSFCPLPRISGTGPKALIRRPGAEGMGITPGLGPATLVSPDPAQVPFALQPHLIRWQGAQYFSG